MLETSRERCDSGCWAWRKPRTSGCWTLGEGRGLCGHHAVSPRGGLHTHSNYFLLFLSLSSLGVGAGGSQLKGRKNEKTRIQSHPQQQNQWEGAKGYFRATKDGNPGAAQGPMNGNQQTALAAAADGDRLPPSTNRVREEAPPAPSPARGGVSLHAGCSTWSRRVGPAERETPPRGRVCAPCAPVSRPRPAPDPRSLRSFSVGTKHPPAPCSPSHRRQRPEVREGRQTHAARFVSAARGRTRAGEEPQVVSCGEGNRRGSPDPYI